MSTEKVKKQESARVMVDLDKTPPISAGNEKFEENMDLEDLLLKSKSIEHIEGYDSDELREKEQEMNIKLKQEELKRELNLSLINEEVHINERHSGEPRIRRNQFMNSNSGMSDANSMSNSFANSNHKKGGASGDGSRVMCDGDLENSGTN